MIMVPINFIVLPPFLPPFSCEETIFLLRSDSAFAGIPPQRILKCFFEKHCRWE
jgi:hypothetical protein